jgi:hypothetical protein
MNKLTEIQQKIVREIGLEYEPLKISVIDSIKILIDMMGEKKIIKNLNEFKKQNKLSEIDLYIADKITHPFYEDYLNIQQTFYDNLILSVYFVLNNPFLYSTYQLEAIYNNLDLIAKIPELINQNLTNCYMNQNLKNFFNEFLFKRWLDSLDFKKNSFEKYISIVGDTENAQSAQTNYNMYSKVWNVFEIIVDETKIIIQSFYQKYKGLNHIPGCSNIPKSFYEYCVETNVGLPFLTKFDTNNKEFKLNLENILQKGIKDYKRIKLEMIDTMTKLEPQLKGKNFGEMLKEINSMKKYKYSSKEEYVKYHKDSIKKYRDFFVEKKGFPLLHEPILVDFDEEKMAGGYWFLDTFYLNTNSWEETNKFDTSALVLHETIPGHHMQLSYEIHHDQIKSLVLWFPVYVNGYAEGWGLFSEKLGHDLDDFNFLGVLSYHMLRTLRILADISIHMYGIEPEEIIDFFAKNLAMPRESIISEVYRYTSLPGQALCYKMGYELIKKLFIKKFNRTNKLLEQDAVNLYIKLIKDGTMPLEIFAKKYEIDLDFK